MSLPGGTGADYSLEIDAGDVQRPFLDPSTLAPLAQPSGREDESGGILSRAPVLRGDMKMEERSAGGLQTPNTAATPEASTAGNAVH